MTLSLIALRQEEKFRAGLLGWRIQEKREEQLLAKARGNVVFNSSCVVLRHKSGAVCIMKAAGCSDSSNCGIAIKNMHGCTIKTAPYLFSDGDKVADAFYNHLLKNRG